MTSVSARPLGRPPAVLALVDCDNFYASCERVFCPRLAGRPVVVLSNNDGIVIARSKEAKALGIAMGAAYHEVRGILRRAGAAVLSSNFALYGDISARVVETLSRFAPEYEVYSIDEVFLSLAGLGGRDLAEYGRSIRATVRCWTGIPVSIGIAPTKTLAKAAAVLAKKTTGVVDLRDSGEIRRLLARMQIEEVWGINRRWGARLRGRGIATALDLAEADPHTVDREMGIVGLRLREELRGVPAIPIEEAPAPRKTCVTSRTFGRAVADLAGLQEAVANFAACAAEKIRAEGSAAGAVTVFIETSHEADTQMGVRPGTRPKYFNSASVSLAVPTASPHDLIRACRRALEGIFREGYDYKRAGVLLSDLAPARARQLDLFEPGGREGSEALLAAVDELNARWGDGTVRPAACGVAPGPASGAGGWRSHPTRRSPRYTTEWGELPVVRAA